MLKIAGKFCLITFLFFTISLSNVFAGVYIDVTPGNTPELPVAFYYMKEYKIQWWYFTGHLFDYSGREFGYELTFFVVGIQKRHYKSRFGADNIYITHFAVSDPGQKYFYFTDSADAGAFGLAGASDKLLKVWSGKASLQGPTKRMHIRASGGTGVNGEAIDLALTPEKSVVLNGEHGYSRKSALSPYQASFYFSYTRLKTEGILTVGGAAVPVKGESWFDREITSRQNFWSVAQGWDWFGIQLRDRREIMLYLIRNRDGSIDPFSSGTFVYDNGRYRHLQKDDFRVTVLSWYRSKKTGALYPSQWEIRIPSEEVALKITPLIEDQECIATATTGNRYWEGDCRVQGTSEGRAYVELTGY
ncbi:MAG: lipocalin-like domain-containing protein [Dissulfurispiraceae bacterium]|jgi:predicted secreted hydrolase